MLSWLLWDFSLPYLTSQFFTLMSLCHIITFFLFLVSISFLHMACMAKLLLWIPYFFAQISFILSLYFFREIHWNFHCNITNNYFFLKWILMTQRNKYILEVLKHRKDIRYKFIKWLKLIVYILYCFKNSIWYHINIDKFLPLPFPRTYSFIPFSLNILLLPATLLWKAEFQSVIPFALFLNFFYFVISSTDVAYNTIYISPRNKFIFNKNPYWIPANYIYLPTQYHSPDF